MLDAVKIQARVLIPIVKALEAELGKARAHALVGGAIAESWSSFVAARSPERDSHPSTDGGALPYPVESEIVENTPESLAINMTACEFARWFREIGEPEIGALLTCGVDFAVNAKLRPSWTFERTQTQMQGAAFCDFRWRLRARTIDAMNQKPLPDIAAMLGQFINGVSQALQPRFLALLERAAAERYEGWAKELPEHAVGLLACRAREIEIAETAEGIFPLDADARAKLDAPLASAREAYFAVLAELSPRDQLRVQAIGERAGGGAWSAFAGAVSDPRARAALERSAALEEANAAQLDAVVARVPA